METIKDEPRHVPDILKDGLGTKQRFQAGAKLLQQKLPLDMRD
jgi:hypothetical protein